MRPFIDEASYRSAFAAFKRTDGVDSGCSLANEAKMIRIGQCDYADNLPAQRRALHSTQLEERGYTRTTASSSRCAARRLQRLHSGHWNFMRPLMAQGLPATIGVQGSVLNDAALAFSSALYSALAVGLSLDEAVTRARLTVLRLGLPDTTKHPSKRPVLISAGGDHAHRSQSGVYRWPLRRCTQTNVGCTA